MQHLICVNPVNLCLKNNETQPPLWCGNWQALFDYSCGLWVRSGDGCLGGYVPGVGVAIQLTLPPQPFRAAWWQPTLFIHVAWVRRVKNVKQGADNECDSCRPFRFTYSGCQSRSAPPALVVWGAGRCFLAIIMHIYSY